METKKQKFIKIIKRIGIGLSLGFNFLFLLAIIIGSVGNKKQVNCCVAESVNVVENVNKGLSKRYVAIDDTNYSITFTADELNNYTWNNLLSYISSNVQYTMFLSNSDYVIPNFVINSRHPEESCIVLEQNNPRVLFAFNNSEMYDDIIVNNFARFGLFDSNGERVLFSGDITINFDSSDNLSDYGANFSTIYSGFIENINLDIESNESNINDGIFVTLTDSVTAFVGSIGSGIVAMTSVFYDSANSQLTTIGLLSVIVVAVSLAYFLFRLLIGLIRMRG